MAILTKIFSNCLNSSDIQIFQYNNILFNPGGSIFFNGSCYTDTNVDSSLVAVFNVVSFGYSDCSECIQQNMVGLYLSSCTSAITTTISVIPSLVPQIGNVLLFNNDCFSFISLTTATSNPVNEILSFSNCEDCELLQTSVERSIGVERVNTINRAFINCCTNQRVTFSINPQEWSSNPNAVQVFVFQNQCYRYDSVQTNPPLSVLATISPPGTIYTSCEYCIVNANHPCLPPPSPSTTKTPTPTPTVTLTPTITRTPSLTPTLTQTPTVSGTETTVTPTPSITPTITPSQSEIITTTTTVTIDECGVLTLYPLGLKCKILTNPTPQNSCLGSLELEISGGTGPYTIKWNHGSTSRIITNLSPGNYSVVVVDNLGDFTGRTTCTIPACGTQRLSTFPFSQTPTNTSTPTLTPTLTPTQTQIPQYCATFNLFTNGGQTTNQFDFLYWVGNGYSNITAWTAQTTQNNQNYLIGTGFLELLFIPSLNLWNIQILESIPAVNWNFQLNSNQPINIWTPSGLTNYLDSFGRSVTIQNVQMTFGPCGSPTLSFTTVNTQPSCVLAQNGSIIVTANGGATPYQYSIDGNTWSVYNSFINLYEGTYTVFVKDFNDIIVSNVVNLIARGLISNQILTWTNTSSQILQSSPLTKQTLRNYILDLSGFTFNGFDLTILSELIIEVDSPVLGTFSTSYGNGFGSFIQIKKNNSTLTTFTILQSVTADTITTTTSLRACNQNQLVYSYLYSFNYQLFNLQKSDTIEIVVNSVQNVVNSSTIQNCPTIVKETINVQTITSNVQLPVCTTLVSGLNVNTYDILESYEIVVS